MQQSKISEYLKTVCEQIRWNKAHAVISEEIENHILDQKNAYMAEGLDEEAATVKAIHEMGDPVLVGTELDRTHRPKPEWSILALTGCVLLLGFAINMFVIQDSDAPAMLTNSIVAALLGVGAMVIAYFLDFTMIGKRAATIYIGLLAAVIAAMLVSPTVNGFVSYVNGQAVQASFLLLLLPTAFAGIVYRMRSRGYVGIAVSGVFFAMPLFVGMAIPSFSSVGLFSLTGLILFTLAIAKGWFHVNKFIATLLVYIPMVMAAAVFTWINKADNSYRWQRLQHAIDPSLDPMGAGYAGTITRGILERAKFMGQGEAEINSHRVLPGVHTDSLLTYLIHEFGWISFIVVLLVLLPLIIRSLVLCSRQKSVLGSLVSVSVLVTFTAQVALYVAYNLGFQLFAPLTLPFISYGGTATIINMFLIGIMLSVFKSGVSFATI